MKTLIVKNALITLVIGFSIIWLISLGEFLVTASQYPVDYVYLIIGMVLAAAVSFLQCEIFNKTLGANRLAFTLFIIRGR